MTVILGLVDNDKVYMASDNAISSGSTRLHTADIPLKILRFDRMLIGCSGEMHIWQKLGRVFAEPPRPENKSDYDYINQFVVPALFKAFDEIKVEFKADKLHLLLGCGGIVCRLFHDGCFVPARFEAIGCGSEFAKGSLSTSFVLDPGMPVKNRMELALQAAVDNSGACYPPFYFMEVPR